MKLPRNREKLPKKRPIFTVYGCKKKSKILNEDSPIVLDPNYKKNEGKKIFKIPTVRLQKNPFFTALFLFECFCLLERQLALFGTRGRMEVKPLLLCGIQSK